MCTSCCYVVRVENPFLQLIDFLAGFPTGISDDRNWKRISEISIWINMDQSWVYSGGGKSPSRNRKPLSTCPAIEGSVVGPVTDGFDNDALPVPPKRRGDRAWPRISVPSTLVDGVNCPAESWSTSAGCRTGVSLLGYIFGPEEASEKDAGRVNG
jgi:hypothetical protein